MAGPKPYDLLPRNKPSSTYLLLSFYVFSLNLVDNSTLCTAFIDKGAISNYMSYNLAIRLGLTLEGGAGVILANGTNMESFTNKKKTKISKDEYEFFTRFRVIKGLNFPIILGMDWWCRNQPIVNLAEKQVAVTLGGKVATLPLVRSPELVSGLQQLNIVDKVNLISSCKKEVAKNQGNGFIAALLAKFAALFNLIAPPKVPQNLFFKIDFKPDANKYFGSPVYSLDILKLKYLRNTLTLS